MLLLLLSLLSNLLLLLMGVEDGFDLVSGMCKVVLELLNLLKLLHELLPEVYLELASGVACELLVSELLAHALDLRERQYERWALKGRFIFMLFVGIVFVLIQCSVTFAGHDMGYELDKLVQFVQYMQHILVSVVVSLGEITVPEWPAHSQFGEPFDIKVELVAALMHIACTQNGRYAGRHRWEACGEVAAEEHDQLLVQLTKLGESLLQRPLLPSKSAENEEGHVRFATEVIPVYGGFDAHSELGAAIY